MMNSQSELAQTLKLDFMRWIPIGIFIIVTILVTVAFRVYNSMQPKIPTIAEVSQQGMSKMVGQQAPLFDLKTIDGKDLVLNSYEGKFVVLNFWASWCAPCIEEIPSLNKLYQSFRGKGLEVISISIDNDKDILDKFLTQHKVDFPIGLDPESEIAKTYSTTGVPETFLLDKKHEIIYHLVGPGDWGDPVLIEGLQRMVAANQK